MVYCCKIDQDSELLSKALALCGEQRKDRAEGVKNEKARAASITAGLLLRYCLLKNGFDDAEVKVTAEGKPYIEGNPIYFSLSHSSEYAACAVDRSPIGIDIQQIVEIKPHILKRFCTPNELEWLEKSENPACDAVKLWALKESWLKASGCSTAQAFETEFILCGDKATGPVGYEFDIDESIEGYITALCRKDVQLL